MNEAMLDALRRQDVAGFTRAARRSPLYRPLGQCAMDYALQGITTLEEVARVTASADAGLLPDKALAGAEDLPDHRESLLEG